MNNRRSHNRLLRTIVLAFVIGFAFVVPNLAAQEGGSIMTRDAEGTTITVWGWDTPEFNRPILDYIEEASGVTVEDIVYSADGVMDNLIVATAAGGIGMPDAFKRNSVDIPVLIEMNAIMDITELVEPYMDLLPDIAWDLVTYDGRIWGVPANSPAGGLFWRYDVVSEYGIDPDDIETWDDFIAAGERLAEESNGAVSLIQSESTGLAWPIPQTIQQQFRAELISEDLTVAIGPDSEEWQNTLVVWRQIRDANIGVEMGQWTEPWYQTIADGSIAVYPTGTWFVEVLKAHAPDSLGGWYFTPFPAVAEGGDRYPSFGSATTFVSATTENPAGAMEWVKAWTMDPQGSLEIGLRELGISVVSLAALDDPFVTAPHEFFANDQAYWVDATQAFFDISYIPPATVYDAEAGDIFNRHLEQWWLGNTTDQEFLAAVAEDLRSTLGLE